ncbi:MAG: hypothetical protein ACQEP5_08785 [Actinomycetota bacterium]
MKKIALVSLIVIILATFACSRLACRRAAPSPGERAEEAAVKSLPDPPPPLEDLAGEEPATADPGIDGMRIGASGVGKWGLAFTGKEAVAEIRHVEGREHYFWEAVDICLNNNIYIIANIDNWTFNGRLEPDEQQWRERVENLVGGLIGRGANKENARITIENEPMKYISREQYVWLVNVAYDQIGQRFYMGAGNEEYDLAKKRGDMYEYLCENANFDILDTHWQASFATPEDIEKKGNWFRELADRHNKRLSVTEANWFDVATSEGYHLLVTKMLKAEQVGSEDFCVVFTSLTDRPQYEWLAFIYDGEVRNQAHWDDFKSRIN